MELAYYLTWPVNFTLKGVCSLCLEMLRGLIAGIANVLIALGWRIDAVGRCPIPNSGAALLVGNHVSFLDAVLVAAVSPRPVRFVMDERYYNPWWCRWFFQLARAIPIASARRNPARLKQAMASIDAALDAGEVVMIFPEGRLTTDGEVGDFRPGVERILARRPVPVITMAIQGVWGSRLSRCPRAEAPKTSGLRRPVRVVWGARIDGARTNSTALKVQVRALRGSKR
ncbi:MAG: 1-acyl-sn-glycerol-3-phosphate acyltransferase [Bradymonadia bacterium]